MNYKGRQTGIPTKFGGSNYGATASGAADVSFGSLGGGKLACSTAQRGKKVHKIFDNSMSESTKIGGMSSAAKGIMTTEKRRSRSAVRQSMSAASARRSLFGSASNLDTIGGGNLNSSRGGASTLNQSTYALNNPVRSWKQDPRRDPKDDREYRSSIVGRIRAACIANGRLIDAKALEHPVTNTFYEVFDTLANSASRVACGTTSSSSQFSMSGSMSQLTNYNNMGGPNQGAGSSGIQTLPICNVLPKEKSDPKTKKAETEERNKQVINALSQLGYPLVVARDLTTVSAGHSWPRLLLALGYLADCVSYSRSLNVDRLLFPRNQRVFQDDSFDGCSEEVASGGVDEEARSEFQLLGDMFRLFLHDDHRGEVQRMTEFRGSILGRYDASIRGNESELSKLQDEMQRIRTDAQALKTTIDAASEKKKRVMAKEQQRSDLIAMLEAAEKELAALRNDVNELKQENEALTQRSNDLRATVRNQERAQLNAKHIAEERVNLERELNSLENARCNIEQQANTVELQISEQARLNAMLSEQYEQAAIEAQIIPSTARFAAGRDFEMKLTYSNVRCCSEVLAGLDQVYVEVSDELRRTESERMEQERDCELITLELEEINRQVSATQSSIETLDREAAHRRTVYGEARETRARELRKLKRDLEELERVKATRENAVEAEQNVLLNQADLALAGYRQHLETSCNEYRMKQEQAEADRAAIIELLREHKKVLEASKRRIESGELQAMIQKWMTTALRDLPKLVASTLASPLVVDSQ